MKITYTRLFADSDGESHFADVEIEFQTLEYAPPAPAVNISAFVPADQCGFLSCASGWYGDWHPSPRRQYFFFLAGKSEMQASDGETRTFEPGDVLLMEDTSGKGHASRVAASTGLFIAVAQLPS